MKNKWIYVVIAMFCFGFVVREFSRMKVQENPHKVINATKATPKTIKEAMKLSKKNGCKNIGLR